MQKKILNDAVNKQLENKENSIGEEFDKLKLFTISTTKNLKNLFFLYC
jgi:hypothetical protein